jgi:hypothetical protein
LGGFCVPSFMATVPLIALTAAAITAYAVCTSTACETTGRDPFDERDVVWIRRDDEDDGGMWASALPPADELTAEGA